MLIAGNPVYGSANRIFFHTGKPLVARVIPCETCIANTGTQTKFLY